MKFKMKGNYSPETKYDIGDVVLFENGEWFYLEEEAPAGTPPTSTWHWNRINQQLSASADLMLSMDVNYEEILEAVDELTDLANAAGAAAEEAKTAAESASAAYGTDLLASDYSTTATYAVGDYVIYDGDLYRCTTAIASGESWTAGHWTQVTVGGETSDLKSAIDNIYSELMQPDFADITSELTTIGNGYYQSPEYGINQWHADSTVITYSLDVKVGETYKISGYNYYQAYLYFARKASGSSPLTAKVFPNTTQTATFYSDEYTIEYDGKLYICTQISKLNVFSVKKSIYISNDYALSEEVKSINRFNPTTAIDGYYMNTNGNPAVGSANYYAYIPVTVGTFNFYVSKGIFGANTSEIPLFDKNKNYLQQATATLAEEGDNYRTLATLTITEQDINSGVAFVGWSGYLTYKYTNMFIYGDEYPSSFIGYFEQYNSIDNGAKNIQVLDNNPLFSKFAVFDGDSICNGSSASDGSAGWASRIGIPNSMGWRNCGVGGATITSGISGVSHYLSSYIDTIHQYYPNIEYLILEGGTNDADRIQTDTSKIGTLNMSDFSGTYDPTTFCGALDTLFYKAINYYPSAKIGFIIAPKMASSNVSPVNNYGTGNTRYDFFKLVMQACQKWGIPYLNLWDDSHLNPSLTVMYNSSLDAQGNRDAGSMYIDGQHLTAKGYGYITPIIEAWMKTL